MTSFPPSARPGRSRSDAFTLIELIVATSIGTIILVAVITTFLMLARSSMRVANYSMMESQTRKAFEQLAIDARMASGFLSTFTGGQITAITLTIPNKDLTAVAQVKYVYDTSTPSNNTFYVVPVPDTTPSSKRVLVTNITSMSFNRYKADESLIDPATTTSDTGIKHIQISISERRSGIGVAAATQVIRSSAFTLRNM